ncbi:MAG: exodeoxyribonuclease III [Alphaproteobacteria bacterium]|nr:exodeoxyribonuclease III [Alphaproteobacteria bacterium]
MSCLLMSWNVASIRARMGLLSQVLSTQQPDIVLLQEVKTLPEQFPWEQLKDLGYQAVLSGEKAFNGVAILAKEPLTEVKTAFDDMPQTQARFIQARWHDYTVVCVYVPNGAPPMNQPEDTSRLAYKLAWFDAFNAYMKTLLAEGRPVILGGDFNVIAQPTDVYNPDVFAGGVLMCDEVLERFDRLQKLPMVNALRCFHKEPHLYSFWDFQGGAWQRNNGILLDAVFVSADVKDRLQDAYLQKELRAAEKPSDHVPLCVKLN